MTQNKIFIYALVTLALFVLISALRSPKQDVENRLLIDVLSMLFEKHQTRYLPKYNQQYGLRATAVVRTDSTGHPIGTLTFTQKSVNSPVIIKGTLMGFQPNSVHVCIKKAYYSSFIFYCRAFTYTKLHYLITSSTALRLVLTLIRTVSILFLLFSHETYQT